MINNNKGFCLFHVIFIVMLVINIFIYILLHNLNRNNYFRDKDKYYQVFIYEERAKRHINERFSVNQPSNNETELLYFDENYIYLDRKSTRLNSSHVRISYAVFCLKKKSRHDRRR